MNRRPFASNPARRREHGTGTVPTPSAGRAVLHDPLVVRCLLVLGLLLVGSAVAAQEPIPVPASAARGLFANVWAEPYDDNGLEPTFRPAEHLVTGTNYRIVMDVAAVRYREPFADRPSVVSVPLRGSYNDDLALIEIVVESEHYDPRATEDYFFSVRDHRAWLPRFVLAYRQEELAATPLRPVDADALELLRSGDPEPPWLFERAVFFVRVRDRPGEAPLGILLRHPERMIDVVSTRFCVAAPGDPAHCDGLPRESEYIGYVMQSHPPPLSSGEEIWPPFTYQQQSFPEGEAQREWTWNSWIARMGDGRRTPVEHLELDDGTAQSTYVLQVDASLYIYDTTLGPLPGEVGHAPGDPALSELARERLARGDTSLRLVVRAEAVGRSVEITGGRVQTIDVDLTRLDPDAPPPLSQGRDFDIMELSALTAAASITVELTPLEPGCSAVALSLADESGRRPVDHLVHYLEVRRPATQATGCGSQGLQTVLSSGVRNILAPGTAPPVDAALHVFELFPDSSGTAAAFFVGPGTRVHSWELERSLTEYLGDAGNLETRIVEARSLTGNGMRHAYDRAAQELADALFSGANPAEQRKADAARAALRDFVADSSEPPTLLARLTDWHGNVLILPLGLLSAPGARAVLDKPIDVVLPLEVEDFAQSGCLRVWAIAVSDQLEGAAAQVPDDVTSDDAWLGASLDDLRRYLGESRQVDGAGMVVAAHHAGGRLRYRENDFPLRAEEVKLAWGDSSAAVLAICSAGGIDPVDNYLLRRLNRFGLDAAIVSPFSLDANYGKVFAIEFARVVREAQARGDEATLAQLFREAVAQTATAMNNHPNPAVRGNVGDMGLELVLVGNPSLHLCKE